MPTNPVRISGNKVAGLSGATDPAAHGAGLGNDGTVTLRNVVLEGNCSNGSGGGLSNGGTASLNNVTITGNGANCNLRAGAFAGGGILSTGTAHLGNTMVAGNVTHGLTSLGRGPDCSGSLASDGYDLIGNLDSCVFGGVLAGNLFGDASPVDAGNPSTPGTGGGACEPVDALNVPRPVGSRCDIGATEKGGAVTRRMTLRPETAAASGNGSVRVKSEFVTAPPTDVLDTAGGLSLTVKTGATSVACAWPASDCASFPSGRVRCRTADRKRQVTFVPSRSMENAYVMIALCRGLSIPPGLRPPFDVTIGQGGIVERVDEVVSCIGLHSGALCVPF